MEDEGLLARAVALVQSSALTLRWPARRVAGSVRQAAAVGAVVVGGYTLLLAGLYASHPYRYFEVHQLELTTAGVSLLTAASNIALMTGIIMQNDGVVELFVALTMAMYLVALPAFMVVSAAVLNNGYSDLPLAELPRIALSYLHLGLLHCLRAELRGDISSDESPPSTPPPAGWLANNLAQRGPKELSAEEAPLKGHAEPLPAPGGPAVLTPSSCTTLASVHQQPTVAPSQP